MSCGSGNEFDVSLETFSPSEGKRFSSKAFSFMRAFKRPNSLSYEPCDSEADDKKTILRKVFAVTMLEKEANEKEMKTKKKMKQKKAKQAAKLKAERERERQRKELWEKEKKQRKEKKRLYREKKLAKADLENAQQQQELQNTVAFLQSVTCKRLQTSKTVEGSRLRS